jgi:hypothetical protein
MSVPARGSWSVGVCDIGVTRRGVYGACECLICVTIGGGWGVHCV